MGSRRRSSERVLLKTTTVLATTLITDRAHSVGGKVHVLRKQELVRERFRIDVPMLPFHAFRPVDFPRLYPERDRLVRFGRDDEVLKVSIVRFSMLFPRRHDPVPRFDAFFDFGVMNLEQQANLTRHGVPDFRDLVTGAANLDELFDRDLALLSLLRMLLLSRMSGQRSGVSGVRSVLFRRSPRQIRLMLFALGVSEVTAFVRMQRQAQSTFERAQMVSQDVGIFREVDRLEGELSKSFSSVQGRFGRSCDTTAAKFGSDSILVIYSSRQHMHIGPSIGSHAYPSP